MTRLRPASQLARPVAILLTAILSSAALLMGAAEAPGKPGPEDCLPGHVLTNVDGSLTCVNQDLADDGAADPGGARQAPPAGDPSSAGTSEDAIDRFLIPQIIMASGLMLAGLLLIGMGLMGRAFRELALNSRGQGQPVYPDDHKWLDRVARLQVFFGVAASMGGFIHGAICWLNVAGG